MSMWKQAWGAAVSAAAIAMVAMPSWAADWTDANGNEYTALKYIKGNGSGSSGGPYIITDFHYHPIGNSVWWGGVRRCGGFGAGRLCANARAVSCASRRRTCARAR
jgi:hypothetical protein